MMNNVSNRFVRLSITAQQNDLKATINSLLKHCFDAFDPRRITVGEGIVKNEGQDPRTWFEGIARGDYPHIFDRTPLRREQTVEDIGNAVVFLSSDHSVNITGQSLMVDGGMVKV